MSEVRPYDSGFNPLQSIFAPFYFPLSSFKSGNANTFCIKFIQLIEATWYWRLVKHSLRLKMLMAAPLDQKEKLKKCLALNFMNINLKVGQRYLVSFGNFSICARIKMALKSFEELGDWMNSTYIYLFWQYVCHDFIFRYFWLVIGGKAPKCSS